MCLSAWVQVFFSDNAIFIHPLHEIMLETEFGVDTSHKLLPLILTIAFSSFTLLICEYYPGTVIKFKYTKLGYNIFGLLNQRFFIELIYNKYITNFILNLGGQTTKVLDRGSVELLGPYGLEKVLITLNNNLNSLSTGVVTSYALYILIGFITFFILPFINSYNSLLVLIILAVFVNINIYKLNYI